MRSKILDHLGIEVEDRQIGYLPGSSSVHLNAKKTLFSSLFSGKVDLVVEHERFSKLVQLSLSQPTINFNMVQIEGTEIETLKTKWKEIAEECWGQDNLFRVNFAVADFQTFPNDSLGKPLEFASAEKFMKLYYGAQGEVATFPDLLHLIAQDYETDGHYKRGYVFTRQLEELIKRGRKRDRINVYVAKDVVTSLQQGPNPPIMLPFGNPGGFVAGWTITGKFYFRRKEVEERIMDNDESLIGIGTGLIDPQPPYYHRLLAHEIGHILIQSDNDHILLGAGEDSLNLMHEYHKGKNLTAVQFIWALGLWKKEPSPFIVSEEVR